MSALTMPVFVTRSLLIILSPLACITLLGRVVPLPLWLRGFLWVLALLLYAPLRSVLRHYYHRREAALLGAQLVPSAQGRWVGNVDLLLTMMEQWMTAYPDDPIKGFIDQHGPVVHVGVLWDDIVVTVWPEHIKIILATDFDNYVKGERFQHSMNSVLGTGVFNADGEMWKFHRSLTRPFFTRDRVTDFEIFDRHADTAITLMKERMRAGYAVDFQDLIARFTMDTATEFLFGQCVDSLSAVLPYPHYATAPLSERNSPRAEAANTFIAAFGKCLIHIAKRERLGWTWPLFEIFKDSTAESMKVVNDYMNPIIHAAVERKRSGSQLVAGNAETLLDELLNSTSDPKILKDETLNILLAGRDTTAHVLTIVIYFLAMYPDVTATLLEEINTQIGTRTPTYDDIKGMKYLRAVINETMRLYPAVPYNERESVQATTWPSPDATQKPFYIPAGTKIMYSVFVMHRRKDLWGEDAESFSPDRFFDERLNKYLLPNPFQFLPFNGGPRICLGQQFAYNEMSFMLIRLLQNFSSVSLDEEACTPELRRPQEWSKAPGRKGMDKFWPKTHLTMYTEGGMWVRMKETEASSKAN